MKGPEQTMDEAGQANENLKREIVERKRAEEELSLHSQVLENMAEGVYLIRTSDGVIVYANPIFDQMFGYDSGELLGRHVSIVNAPTEKSPEETAGEIITVLNEKGIWHGEVQSIKKDRTPFWCSAHVTTFEHSEYGEVWISVHEDITERKRAEEEKTALEVQLRQAQKMEAVGQLTAGIAHNFNNLLQGIMGSLDLALLDAPASLRPHLLDAENTLKRGADIVEQLMLFTHFGGPGESNPVDINQVLGDTVAICRRTFDRRISITVETPASESTVIGDSGQLQQVFLNMCLNARDALEEVVDRDPAIAISVDLQSDIEAIQKGGLREFVRIQVADNGPGMAKEIQPKVFEPFFTTKEVGRGTGLGLATAFGIVQQHGGSIDCESKLDVGTTFTVRLPAVETRADVEADETSELAPEGSEIILLVDDEMAVRTSLAAYLSRLGYTVLAASDGVDGLETYMQNARDIALVLLDLSLPGMSGHDVLREMRRRNADVRVIIFTGYAFEESEFEEAMPILHKPIDSERVARKIREVLEAEKETRRLDFVWQSPRSLT